MIDLRSSRLAHAAAALFLTVLGGAGTAPQEGAALSASADVGRVLDREGTAARRPALADRWGPAEPGTPLEAGDWLEVGTRGANALRVRLAGGAELILGPGALVEVAEGARIGLLRGEVLVDAPEDGAVEVSGPGRATIEVDGRAALRAAERRLTRLQEDPGWLVGYESNASTEALGSLLAKVDGRNVPLTIGYHKVTVDVRDQIARTVIEESFVNHTSSVLEGVFYFPLPADASISGFGMWIGNELVQGEIVEKQRAREIYETILRERRDPGSPGVDRRQHLQGARVPDRDARSASASPTPRCWRRRATSTPTTTGWRASSCSTNPLGRLEITGPREPPRSHWPSVEFPSHACRIRHRPTLGSGGVRVPRSSRPSATSSCASPPGPESRAGGSDGHPAPARGRWLLHAPRRRAAAAEGAPMDAGSD